MADRKGESEGRVLSNTQVGKFTLLNSEKLGRVLDLIEGNIEPNEKEAAALEVCKGLAREKTIVALYDRLGGAIKLDERALRIGTFWNFSEAKPIEKPNLSEEDFADEMVLVRKSSRKGKKAESTADRVARLEKVAGATAGATKRGKKAKAE